MVDSISYKKHPNTCVSRRVCPHQVNVRRHLGQTGCATTGKWCYSGPNSWANQNKFYWRWIKFDCATPRPLSLLQSILYCPLHVFCVEVCLSTPQSFTREVFSLLFPPNHIRSRGGGGIIFYIYFITTVFTQLNVSGFPLKMWLLPV